MEGQLLLGTVGPERPSRVLPDSWGLKWQLWKVIHLGIQPFSVLRKCNTPAPQMVFWREKGPGVCEAPAVGQALSHHAC